MMDNWYTMSAKNNSIHVLETKNSLSLMHGSCHFYRIPITLFMLYIHSLLKVIKVFQITHELEKVLPQWKKQCEDNHLDSNAKRDQFFRSAPYTTSISVG